MKVLSLFDGISCARVALDRAGIKVTSYYASEIDPYAIAISKKNWPTIQHVGDVKNIVVPNVGGCEFDLLIGGSPCQDLSISKQNRKGLDGDRSSLFYEYLRILHSFKPKYFILENVASMPEEAKNEITKQLGVDPILIDAELVSAQLRRRLFWTNILGVTLPEQRGIVIKDIVDFGVQHKIVSPKGALMKTKRGVRWDSSGKGYFSTNDRAYTILGKHPTVPTARTITKCNVLAEDGRIFVLNWEELERLQCLPVGYTDLGPDNRLEKRGGVIGNGFNVEVVAHILRSI